MTGSFLHADFDVLNDLWERCYPERYWVSADLLKSHTVGSVGFSDPLSRWEIYADHLTAYACVKKPEWVSSYPVSNPTQFHLNCLVFKDFGAATKLLDVIELNCRSHGATHLRFGQDQRHFWPGVPTDFEHYADFLESRGYVREPEAYDVERDLSDFEAPIFAHEGFEVRACAGDDLTALTAFFDAEFPHRWKHDVFAHWKLAGPESVIGLFQGSVCFGFALVQHEPAPVPIGGAVWKRSLGEQWGSLGPIGVAKSVRGQGLGEGLLAEALRLLKERGARQTIIDWTTLGEFYGKQGFAISRRYVPMVKEL